MRSLRPTRQPERMWVRWVIASLVAASLIAATVIAVQRAGPENATSEEAIEGETNRIADISVAEDEAPQTATATTGATPASALERAIGEDVHGRISRGQLTGPLQSVTCAAGLASGVRAAYTCRVRSDGAAYLFMAVVSEAGKRLTWCKVDPSSPAAGGPEVLISPRCRA
jgi:hypothetical protein